MNYQNKMELLIPIQPQHLVSILNGDKTLELRKLLPKNFDELVKKYGGIWVNLYCVKAKLYLVETTTLDYGTFKKLGNDFILITNKEIVSGVLNMVPFNILNGKVVARFWFDEYGELIFNLTHWRFEYNAWGEDVSKDLCLTTNEIMSYRANKNITLKNEKGIFYYPSKNKKPDYLWRIKRLEIFDTPKELSDFYYFRTATVYCGMDCPPYVDEVKYTLRKAPKNFRYVYVKGEE